VIKIFLIALVALLTQIAPAAADCVLKEIVRTNVSGELSIVNNIRKSILPASANKRQCVVNFDALVKDKWHKAMGLYVFGNSVAEERACAMALNDGKQRLLEKLFPQGVQAEALLLCDDGAKTTTISGLDGLIADSSRRFFYYKGSNCGWFVETIAANFDLHQWTVIACEVQPNRWQRVDRFMRF